MLQCRSLVYLWACCGYVSYLQCAGFWAIGTYGDGLETRVEETIVEEGCIGVGEDDGLGVEDEDGLGVGVDDDVGLGVDDGVGLGVALGVGVEVGVGRTVTVVFRVVVVVVVTPLVMVEVAVPERRMLLQKSAASDVCPSNASNPQSSTNDGVRQLCRCAKRGHTIRISPLPLYATRRFYTRNERYR